jgi:hypothetical protein
VLIITYNRAHATLAAGTLRHSKLPGLGFTNYLHGRRGPIEGKRVIVCLDIVRIPVRTSTSPSSSAGASVLLHFSGTLMDHRRWSHAWRFECSANAPSTSFSSTPSSTAPPRCLIDYICRDKVRVVRHLEPTRAGDQPRRRLVGDANDVTTSVAATTARRADARIAEQKPA